MVGVLVAFIRVVYGRTIYMSLPFSYTVVVTEQTEPKKFSGVFLRFPVISLSHDGKPSNTCSRFVRLEMVVFFFIGFLLISCALRNIITTEGYHKMAVT